MKIVFLSQIIFIIITGCSNKKAFDSDYYCKKLKINCTKNNERVVFITSKGDFEVQLFVNNYPVTTNNFKLNVKKNIYSKKIFYKIISYPQVEIIQSGIYPRDKYDKNQDFTNKSLNIPLELKFKKEAEPIYGYQVINPLRISKLETLFEKGSLAMVKSGKNESSSTEFFFVTDKFPELNGRYTVFGKIVRGIEVLENIEKNDLIYEIQFLN